MITRYYFNKEVVQYMVLNSRSISKVWTSFLH